MKTIISGYIAALATLLNEPPADVTIRRQGHTLTDVNFPTYSKPDCVNSMEVAHPFKVYLKEVCITQFNLVEFPGCCAFCISTGAVVFGNFRGRGINNLTNKLRQAIARDWGYTTIICTDRFDNEAERRTLATNGWTDIYSVRNRRTGNDICISVKQLEES